MLDSAGSPQGYPTGTTGHHLKPKSLQMTAHVFPACPDVVIASPVGLDPADRAGAFWQCAVDQAALSEQQRLEAIEQGWSSRWLVALREHLHLRLAALESLLAMSEATLARRVRQEGPLEPAVSERLDRLLEAIGLALGVFEDPAITAVALFDQVPFRLDQRLTGS